MADSEHIGRRIRAILYDRGWTNKRLALETGWGYLHVCRMLRGERPIPLRFLVSCERALDLPAGFLREKVSA